MSLSKNQAITLDALAVHGGELCGLDLAEIIGSLARSSVYAALSALQRDGLVDARWDMSESHPRRMVTISEQGLKALSASRLELRAAKTRARNMRRASAEV